MEDTNLTNFRENGSKDEGIRDVESENKGHKCCNLQQKSDNAIVKTEIKMEDDDIYESASENDSIDEGGNRTAGIERNGEEPWNIQGVKLRQDSEIAKTEIKMEDDDDDDDDIPDSSTDNGTKDEEGSSFTVGTERNGYLEDVLDDTIVKSEIKMEEDDIIDCPTESTSNDEEVNKDVQTETDPGETQVQMKKANANNNIRMEDCVFSGSAIQFLQKLKSSLLMNEIVPEHAGRIHNARTDEMPTDIETTKNGWTKLNHVLFKDGILINNTDFLHSFTQSALLQESEQPNMLCEKNNTVDTGKNVQETLESSEIETYNIVVMQEKITVEDTFFCNSAIQSGFNNNAETNENSFNKVRRLESVTENELNNTILNAIDTTEDARLQVSAHPIHFNNISETYEAVTTAKNGQEPFQDPEVESDHVVVRKETVKVGNIGNNGQEHFQGPGIETDIKIMMRCSVSLQKLSCIKKYGWEHSEGPEVESDHLVAIKGTVKEAYIGKNGQDHFQDPEVESHIQTVRKCSLSLESLPSIENYCPEPVEYSIGVLPILDCQQSGLIQVQTNDMSAQMNGQGLIIDSEADITTEKNNDILFINLSVLNNKPEQVDAEMDGQDPLTCIEIYEDDILSFSETRDARLVESDNKGKAWPDKEVSIEEFQDLGDEFMDVDEDFSNEDEQPLSVLPKQKNPLKYGDNKAGTGKQVSTEKDMHDRNQKIEIAHKNYKCNLCDETFTLKFKYQEHLFYHTIRNMKCFKCHRMFGSGVALKNHMQTHHNEKPPQQKKLLRPVESDSEEKSWSDEEVSAEEFQDLGDECIYVDEDFSDEDDQPLSVLAKHNQYKNKAGSGKQVSTEKDVHDPNQKIEIVHKNYKCNLCHETFILKSKYQVHLLYHGNMKCLKCHRMFDSGVTLKNHMQTNHFEELNKHLSSTHMDKNVHNCSVCQKSFIDQKSWLNHQLIHQFTNSYKCIHCNKLYGTIVHLNKHLLTHDARPLESDSKGKAWSDEEVSTGVFQDMNDDECIYIDEDFSDEDDQPLSVLAKHNPIEYKVKNKAGSGKQVSTELESEPVDAEMNGQDTLTCIEIYDDDILSSDVEFVDSEEVQNKVVSTEKDLLAPNLKIKIAQKNYNCNLCDKTFTLKPKYQVHLLYHGNMKCLKCHRMFDSGVTLKNHMQTNHFQELNKHLSIHMDKNIHKCPVCQKSFIDQNSLLNHKLIHQFTNSYKCIHCNKLYGTIVHLNKHLLTHDARPIESDSKGKACSDKEVATGEFQDLSDECIFVDEDFSDEDDQPLPVLAKHNPIKYKFKNKAGSGKQVSTELESEPVDAAMNGQDTLTCIEIYDDDILSSDVEFVDSKEVHDKVVSTEKDLHDPNQKIEIAHKNYKCNLCDETFTQKSNFQNHLFYHTIGSMKCSKCHRMFDSGVALQNHMKTNRCEKPPCPRSVLTKHNPLKYIVKNKAGSGKQVSTELTFQDILTERNEQNSSEDRITEFNQNLDADKNVSESANHQQNYMCIGCGDMFTNTEELEKHEITHKKYECDLCENVFNQYSKYQQHLVYHINGDKLNCLHCKKSFDSGLTLKCHMQTRNCKQCRKCLRSSAALEQHMQFIHSGINPYKCTKCDEGFLLAEELDKHSLIHSYKKVHTCPLCCKMFYKRGKLNAHFRRHGDKNYICTICSKAFVAQHDLDSHMLFHNGVKNHICNICSKAFMRSCSLNKHLRKHTGIQPHKCPLCDKRFSHIKRVKRHLVVIHYGKKEHKCIHCNECFALFRDLEKHYAIHNDPRPSKCKECPKSFAKQQQLITHMLSHSGVKPHQCVQCGSTFRLPHHLRNHLLTHSAKNRPKSK